MDTAKRNVTASSNGWAGPAPIVAPDAAEAGPMLVLDRITHRYGALTAVEDVTLELRRHETVCLLGPSGCGKSTLLRVAAGLERPTRGRVLIDGALMAGDGAWVGPEHRHLGLVFQESALFPHLRVAENVRFGLQGLRRQDADRRVQNGLAQLGMAEYADAYPHTLSGGQQQRVALARAMAPAPRVMLFDEPFSSLDARLREQIREDTLHLLRRSGTATLLVTHDPEEAMFMADRIALMRDGRIEQFGTPAELYCRPANAFVATFLGPTNAFTGTVHEGAVRTPFGTVAATGFANGAAVTVILRQEALRVRTLPDGAETPSDSRSDDQSAGTVILARLLGPESLLHLGIRDIDGQPCEVHARVPGVVLPAPGSQVELSLDRSQVFVFPAITSGSGTAAGMPVPA